MANPITTIINRFDGGLLNDPRERVSGSCSLIKNLDISTNPHKLTPRRDSESGDVNASTSQKQNFAIGLWTASSPDKYKLFGLGVVSGQSYAEVLMKDLTTTSTDLSDDAWDTPANNASASGSTSMNLFTYYAKTGKIYGARAGSHIWAFTPDGATAFDDSDDTLTYTDIGEGLVHSKDDILYVPYYYDGAGVGANVVSAIMSKDGAGAWNKTALELPSYLKPTSICEYGNYIAIAMSPVNNVGKSFVYLWNRDSTLATLSESIEWGTGQMKVLEEIEGFLVGISTYIDGTRDIGRVVFRAYAGGSPKTFFTLQSDSSTTEIVRSGKSKIDERLYFMMQLTKDGTVREGVWSVYLAANGRLSVVHESTPNNDTELGAGTMYGFIKVGDYLFQSYTDSSAVFGLSKTTGTGQTSTYNHGAVFHTNINPNMAANTMSLKKQLQSVSLSYVPLAHRSTVKLEYKVDGGSWVEIFTDKADDSDTPATLARVGAINLEAVVDVNGDQFKEGREYEFRITSGGAGTASTSNAEITELKYKVDLLDTQI